MSLELKDESVDAFLFFIFPVIRKVSMLDFEDYGSLIFSPEVLVKFIDFVGKILIAIAVRKKFYYLNWKMADSSLLIMFHHFLTAKCFFRNFQIFFFNLEKSFKIWKLPKIGLGFIFLNWAFVFEPIKKQLHRID